MSNAGSIGKIGADAAAGDAADAGADLLNGCHKWISYDHCPEQGVAELRTHLRIGCDPTWIIVGRAGDQSRTQEQENGLQPAMGRGFPVV